MVKNDGVVGAYSDGSAVHPQLHIFGIYLAAAAAKCAWVDLVDAS